MNVLIDTNVVLDVLSKREPFYPDSLKIFKLCETGRINGYISALSIADIIYILRKELNPEKIKTVIDTLFVIFKINDLKAEDLKPAASLTFSDYEDALQSMCAKRTNCMYIITRNTNDFKSSSIPAITPKEFSYLI